MLDRQFDLVIPPALLLVFGFDLHQLVLSHVLQTRGDPVHMLLDGGEHVDENGRALGPCYREKPHLLCNVRIPTIARMYSDLMPRSVPI